MLTSGLQHEQFQMNALCKSENRCHGFIRMLFVLRGGGCVRMSNKVSFKFVLRCSCGWLLNPGMMENIYTEQPQHLLFRLGNLGFRGSLLNTHTTGVSTGLSMIFLVWYTFWLHAQANNSFNLQPAIRSKALKVRMSSQANYLQGAMCAFKDNSSYLVEATAAVIIAEGPRVTIIPTDMRLKHF